MAASVLPSMWHVSSPMTLGWKEESILTNFHVLDMEINTKTMNFNVPLLTQLLTLSYKFLTSILNFGKALSTWWKIVSNLQKHLGLRLGIIISKLISSDPCLASLYM